MPLIEIVENAVKKDLTKSFFYIIIVVGGINPQNTNICLSTQKGDERAFVCVNPKFGREHLFAFLRSCDTPGDVVRSYLDPTHQDALRAFFGVFARTRKTRTFVWVKGAALFLLLFFSSSSISQIGPFCQEFLKNFF